MFNRFSRRPLTSNLPGSFLDSKARSLSGLDSDLAGDAEPAALAARAGRAGGLRGGRAGLNRHWSPLETLEQRQLLDGDHPGLPVPWNPGQGTLIALNTVAPATSVDRGRGVTAGTITTTDTGDLFRFVIPATAGRTKEFVSVLADTIGAGSTLDTFVEIYDNAGTLIASGANNGTLSIGLGAGAAPDGWVGFEGDVGSTYYARVRRDPNLAAGRTATGNYTIRIDASTLDLPINANPAGQLGAGSLPGNIATRQDDIVYRVQTRNLAAANSLAIFSAISEDQTLFNPHLDVFGAASNQSGLRGFIRQDTDAGRLTDSFLTVRSAPNQTYYVRVRGDDLRATGASLGEFSVQVRTEAVAIDVDPIIRVGSADNAIAPLARSFPPVPTPMGAPVPPAGTGSQVYVFTAQGNGVGIITITSPPPPFGVPQPAIRVLDDAGNSIDFAKGNGLAQLEIPVTGGQRYYIIAEGFDNAANGGTTIVVEAHHTFDPFIPIDDHLTTTVTGSRLDGNVLTWRNATPIRFGDPFQLTDLDGVPLRDRTWLQSGTGRGRIYRAGDSDLFQFVAPVNQLDQYAGSDTNANSGLFIGGNFARVGNDPRTGQPYNGNNVAIQDAGNYFQAGPLLETTNADPSALNGPIFAMAVWDPDGAGAGLPVLAVGGQFTRVWNPLVNNGQGDNIAIENLVFRIFDTATSQWVWSADPLSPTNDAPLAATGGAGAGVFALGAGDIFDETSQGLAASELYVGGVFTNLGGPGINNIGGLLLTPGGLARSTLAGGATGGANPGVFSMTFWDPPQPAAFLPQAAPGTGQAPPQQFNLPTQLFFGGRFTTAGGQQANNIARAGGNGDSTAPGFEVRGLNANFNITYGMAAPGTATPINFGVNVGATGAVRALTIWDDPGSVTNTSGTYSQEPMLIIGGDFSVNATDPRAGAGSNTVVRNNLVGYDFLTVTDFAQAPATASANRGLRYRAITAQNLNQGPVRALTSWNLPLISGGVITSGDASRAVLAIGRDLTATTSEVATLAGVNAGTTALFAAVDDGLVRALVAFNDTELGYSPGVNADGSRALFQTLHVGGDFTSIDGTPGFNGLARFEINLPANLVGFQPLGGGVQGTSDGTPGGERPSVNAMAFFNDNVPGLWDRAERPGTRVQIRLAKPGDGAPLDGFIEVFDSQGNLVYSNDTLDPTGQNDLAGANDPTRPPAFGNPGDPPGAGPNRPFTGNTVAVWAGEVYYVRVSGVSGAGRYTVNVQTDAPPPKATPNNDGRNPDDRTTLISPVGEGQFVDAPEISLGADGKGRAYLAPLAANPSAFTRRAHARTPTGTARTEFSDSPTIMSPTDSHLYFFRATNDGTVEVRLSTFNIRRSYQEVFVNAAGQRSTVTSTKTISSPLHGAVRVFNNDFVQLGYNNYNGAVSGFLDTYQVRPDNSGTGAPDADNGVRSFQQTDPRLVVNVRRGNVYYIQVESAYRGSFASNPDLVDWRFASGAYDLVVSGTPSLNGVDDHYPDGFSANIADGVNGSVIPIDPTTGRGSINGEIRNLPVGPFANPDDNDSFIFIAESRGQVRVTINATDPLLQARVRVFEDATFSLLTTGSTTPGGSFTVNFPTEQGQRFFIVVDGNATQGRYTVSVESPAFSDDQRLMETTPSGIAQSPVGGWITATPLTLNRFQGQFGRPDPSTGTITTAAGSIENPGDEDLFKFTAEAFEFATVQVNALDPTLDPFVEVYEVSRDGEDRQVFLRIAVNNDQTATNTNSRVSFSVSPGRDYYVRVSGASPFTHFGRYNLGVTVAPTDDHPNQSDFPSGSIIDLAFDPLNFTGSGTRTGLIEITGDNDLFRFTPNATGAASIILTRPISSTLALDVVVLDANNVPLPGVTITPNAGRSQITITMPAIVQGVQYYLNVRAATTLPGGTTDTGAYSIAINTTPADDYPNAGQFNIAQSVALSSVNGVGTISGTLVPIGDTDLFRFNALAAGNVTVRVTTPGSGLNPKITIFSSSQTQLFAVNGNGDSSSVTFTASAVNQLFYVLVTASDGSTGAAAVGSYTVTINGALPGGGGGGGGVDDFPNAGEWADADSRAVIGIDTRTGNGSVNAVIAPAGDSDLFTFTVGGSGIIDLQVVTPAGGLVDGQIKLFNSSRVQIATDSAGIPGSTAALRFNGNAGDKFFVLVEPVGAATGSYTLRLATQPLTHFLYFPEGFAGSSIDEFVPIVNPNSTAVDYQIFARYETGENPSTPIFSGTIAGNSRGGVTVFTRNNPGASLVRIGVPYSLEIRSTGPLGATFSHYDFNASVGEAFTNRTSTTWTFAELNKDRNTYRDFLLFYNPGSSTANLNVTLFYQDGATVTFQATVDANRRGGVNIDADSRVTRNGRFGVRIDSDQPIVSSVSSYNLARGGGDGLLGDADGGSNRGVVTNISSGAGVTSNLSVLNANNSATTVTIVADYGRTDLPKITRIVTIDPRTQFSLSLSDLGLIPGQTAGLTYTSSLPVTFQALEYKLGDGNVTTTQTSAARTFFFGDLFVNPRQAGLQYIEQLGLYNPTNVAIDVTVRFLFADGSPTRTIVQRVNASTFAFVSIDQQQAILSRPGATAFSLIVESATPIVASLTHYDLFLNGGWSAAGAPLGLTTPLTSL